MKKVTNMSLTGIAFSIEEDAYDVLKKYLSAIEAHFSSEQDGEEILTDIESGIAEKLMIELKTPQSAVTLLMVEKVIKEMGRVGDIIGEKDYASADDEASAMNAQKEKRRLFRNTDDVIIAGVASGIAKYLDIDPVYTRLAFVLAIFLNGIGLVAYIVLWLVMRPAKTTTEKYQMRGEKVTLSSIAKQIEDSVEVGVHRSKDGASSVIGMSARIINILNAIFRFLGIIVRFFLKVLRYIVGIVLTIKGVVAFAVLISITTIMLFVTDPASTDPFTSTIISEIKGSTAGIVFLAAAFWALLTPIVVFIMAGVSLVSGRNRFTMPLVLALGIEWIIAFSIALSTFLIILPGLNATIEEAESEYFQVISETISTEPFDSLDVRGGKKVTILEGDEYSVEITGLERELQEVSVTIQERNLLVISDEPNFRFCIFCFRSRHGLGVVITTPEPIIGITARNSVSVSGEGMFAGEDLILHVANSSSVTLSDVEAENLVTAEVSNSSRIQLTGSAPVFNMTVSNSSRVNAKEFTTSTTTVAVSNSSHADVNAINALSGSVRNSSSVTQYGTAPIENVEESNSSRVEIGE